MSQINAGGASKISRDAIVADGVINLQVVFEVLRGRAYFLLLAVAMAMTAASVYLHFATQTFQVRLEVISATNPSTSKSGLGALTSLAGISISDSENPKFQLFLGTLRSPMAAQLLARNQEILRGLFPNEWSNTRHAWREPPSTIRPIFHGLARALGIYVAPWTPPGPDRIFKYLKRNLAIIENEKSGVVTLQIDSDRPAVAANVLVALNNAIDERLREQDLSHSSADIDYLAHRLELVTVEDYRAALVRNLEEQEKAKMLATAPVPYVSDILGGPTISSGPVYPSPVAVYAVAIFLGGCVGLLLALRNYRLVNRGVDRRS